MDLAVDEVGRAQCLHVTRGDRRGRQRQLVRVGDERTLAPGDGEIRGQRSREQSVDQRPLGDRADGGTAQDATETRSVMVDSVRAVVQSRDPHGQHLALASGERPRGV
ncbi:MAG: hypothetical protein OEW77_09000, partial [Gemmatimonadota bacterium]|nr:hypothetical protein [Gemmatimonadota bacterium]